MLAFPANNFAAAGHRCGNQSFCTGTFGVKFPLFSKISVIGDDKHPLYRSLTQAQPQATGDGLFRARLEGYGIQPNPAPEVQELREVS